MIKFLDLRKQYQSIKDEMDNIIFETIQKGNFIGGDLISTFEKQFAKYIGSNHCIGVANGTDALEISIEALNLPPRSEILVPALSFISTSEAVSRQGHQVKFVDINEDFTICTEDLISKITSNTKALICVHLYGHPCKMKELLAISKKFKLYLIEDCAQAHGAKYDGVSVGTFGHISTFSFYPGKNLGAYGDAGAILTNNKSLSGKCRMIANHGRKEKYDHLFEGRNSRLDTIQAAVLSVKLKYLDEWIKKRNFAASYYNENLKNIQQIRTPIISEKVYHSFHLYVIQTKKRDELMSFLKNKGIESGIHYPILLPNLKAYSNYNFNNFQKSTELTKNILSLPIGEHLEIKELEFIVKTIKSFYKK
jgi:dTDP-4-amino-4,6-dideoxygalactose transaminase